MKKPGPGPVRCQVIPAACGKDDVAAECRKREPGPAVRGAPAHYFFFLRVAFRAGRLAAFALGFAFVLGFL